MPLEFALRPRIRLSEGFAPPRRSRFRVPKFALPILAYWLAAGGITYELIHWHDAPSELARPASVLPTPTSEPEAPAHLAAEPAPAREALKRSETPTTPEAPAAPETESETETEPARTVWPPAHESLASANPTRPDDAPRRHHHRRPLIDPTDLPPAPAPSHVDETPRISTNLFPRDDQAPAPPEAPAAPATTHFTSHAGDSLPGCEAAAAAAKEELDLSRRNLTSDLSRESIAMVLDDGAWLSGCAVPEATSINVCVAISSGRVLGATVVSQPANSTVTTCVKRRAAGLMFPYSSHLDIAHTHFDAH